MRGDSFTCVGGAAAVDVSVQTRRPLRPWVEFFAGSHGGSGYLLEAPPDRSPEQRNRLTFPPTVHMGSRPSTSSSVTCGFDYFL